MNFVNLPNADSTIVSAHSSDPQQDPPQQEGRELTEESLLRSDNHIKKEQIKEPYWESLTSMNIARSKFGSATHNNKIYIFCGKFKRAARNSKKGVKCNKAEVYDPQANTWTDLPSMPTARINCSCTVVDDDIYIIGGELENEKSSTKKCMVFHTMTKKYSTIPPMKFCTDKHESIAVGKCIYVFGGYRAKGTTQIYDTETQKWTVKSSMNIPRYSFTSAVIGNTIYAIGGMKDYAIGKVKNVPKYHRYVETMEEYDIEADKWTISQQKMKNRRAGGSAVVIGGSTIKVIGGYDEKGIITAIESFDTLHQKWSGSYIIPSK